MLKHEEKGAEHVTTEDYSHGSICELMLIQYNSCSLKSSQNNVIYGNLKLNAKHCTAKANVVSPVLISTLRNITNPQMFMCHHHCWQSINCPPAGCVTVNLR